MGWCSATEIMDAVVAGAEKAAFDVLDNMGKGDEAASWRPTVDAALRPFVATVAEKLRDSDWDCIDESEYFDRFPQEMLGYDDQEYRAYLHKQLRDTDPGEYNYSDLVRKLANIQAKLEGDSGTG